MTAKSFVRFVVTFQTFTRLGPKPCAEDAQNMKYATIRYHLTTFHIHTCIAGRNNFFLVCGRVT